MSQATDTAYRNVVRHFEAALTRVTALQKAAMRASDQRIALCAANLIAIAKRWDRKAKGQSLDVIRAVVEDSARAITKLNAAASSARNAALATEASQVFSAYVDLAKPFDELSDAINQDAGVKP